ncbi:hypothetical protein BRYFOR_07464 [Marvinbryantia formatexigens DSM 14469]|uniref:DUF1700 domain-containing protein n=1 Tax=Marvinbryantia formatexigens DSM 14469 TaxID=478749 RepID=C6LFQ4_9FIRM|nr:DUF1700 domain-containing protein [Marvinbryantia formatexigens]EET60639.1 hypothetical protein BRYFOR_07464 [Marvinbryantia formatexigens DSM 14469]UWO25624.1 DUF1700 domain-containing protein [Marvinbryantia formatexigens DSM 14469]SDG16941.1 Protein of unknown function [Marvinbryantia formatexigens]
MTKREFLDTLRTQLEGELSPAQIEGHLHYYDEYISGAVAAGRRESDVLEELGSPVFIAKTLLEASEAETEKENGGYYEETPRQEEFHRRVHTWNINPLVVKWVLPIAGILIVLLLLWLVGSVAAFAIRYFVPILLIILVISIFRRHGR